MLKIKEAFFKFIANALFFKLDAKIKKITRKSHSIFGLSGFGLS
jgi:hypothetical protein